MRLRPIMVALPLALALWALVGLGVRAAAAPGVQTVSDRAGAVISDVLGVELEPRLVVTTDDLYFQDSDAEVWPLEPGTYRIRPWVARLVRSGELSWTERGPTMLGLHVVVHERLHRHATVACWHPQGGLSVEEGITEALALDLLPSIAWRLYGERVRFYLADRRDEVRAIRAASALGSGSRTWKTRAARLWRRDLWRSDCAGRARMLAEATAMRGE